MLCAIAVGVFAVSMLTATEASAQSFDALEKDQQKDFDRFLDKCITAYDKGRYADAESLCGQAAAITEHPATTYVIARIRDREGRCEDAVGLYKQIRDGAPAGASEARWVEEYQGKLDEYIEILGDCSARIDVQCADAGAIILIDNQVLGTCPETVTTTPGDRRVTVVTSGRNPATQTVNATPGRPTSVEFGALTPYSAPSGPGLVNVSCPDFADGAAVTFQGDVLGVCPLSVQLPAGSQKLFGQDSTGRRGIALVDVDTGGAEQDAILVPFRTVNVSCADPEVRIAIQANTLEQPIDDTCGNLESAGGMQLPDGTFSVALSRDNHQPRTLEVEIGPDSTDIQIDELDRLPVEVTVTCAQTDEPPVMVRIGKLQGACPLTGQVPEGSYTLEARREGHESYEAPVEFALGADNSVQVPALEDKSFWTPGTITAISGGGIIVIAVIVDVVGLSDLNELRDISDGDWEGTRDEARARYDELRPSVNANIWATRVLYTVGIAAAATGVGLIIWELVSDDPDSFEDDTSAFRVVPSLGFDASGAAAPGASVHFRF